MLLGHIRSYIKQQGTLSVNDIVNHFDIDPSSAQFAIDYWVQRKKIHKINPSCNTSCNNCHSSQTNYQWHEHTLNFFK